MNAMKPFMVRLLTGGPLSFILSPAYLLLNFTYLLALYNV